MSESTALPPTPSTPLVIRAVLRTDVGRVRSENQDFGVLSTREEEVRDGHPGGRLMIVADGMGGHRGGATASRVATETVKAQYLGSETDDVAAALRDALTRANARVFAEAQSNPDLRGMGTTTSALVVRGDEAWLAHVGDSRIYLVRNDEISQLTDDHSLVASMVREGLLTAQEAENHPRRNVLQRSIGVSEDVEIDIRGPLKIEIGDTFIICSDGLHGVVKAQEIRDVARQSIEAAADEFIRRALERGAPDNVTVIVARAERGGDGAAADLEETQVERSDRAMFDDTVRDVPAPMLQPSPAATSSEPEASPAEPVSTPEPTPSESRPGGRTTRNPFLKWMFIVVAVLGFTGAWFYWIH